MKYQTVSKAQYDYNAQDEGELSFKEDDILYTLDSPDNDEEWVKAQLKMPNPEEIGPEGLIPRNYIEELPPVVTVQAAFEYEALDADQLSFPEGAVMNVFEKDDPNWWLVGYEGEIGLVPANYMEAEGPEPTQNGQEAVAYEESTEEPIEEISVSPTDKQRSLLAALSNAAHQSNTYVDPLKLYAQQADLRSRSGATSPTRVDETKTFPVTELDKKKKKKGKGTLGIGAGMIFYGSETDKAAAVRQWDIINVDKYEQEGKSVHLEIGGEKPAVFDFQTTDKKDSKAIVTKISDTLSRANLPKLKEVSVGAPGSGRAAASPSPIEEQEQEPEPEPEPEPEYHEPEPEPEPEPEQLSCEPRWGVVQYDFTGQGEDELNVTEGEQVLIVDYVNDADWWRIQVDGSEGVIPANYLLFQEDHDAVVAAEQERQQQEDLEYQRQQEEISQQQEEEEAARQAEEDAWYRQQQQEEERKRQAEERRKAEAERRRKQQEQARKQAEAELAAKRKEQKAQTPIKKSAGPSLPSRPKAASAISPPAKPTVSNTNVTNGANKRDPSKPTDTREWTDRTSTFKVEAQYLGVHDGKIRLWKTNGVKIDVPLEKMCMEDIEFIESILGEKVINDKPSPIPVRVSSATNKPSISKPVAKEEKKWNRDWDWFDWFLKAKVEMDDALRYSSAFSGEKMDEKDIDTLDNATLKMLGIKDKDRIKVMRYIATGDASTPEEELPEIMKAKRSVSFGETSVLGEYEDEETSEDPNITRRLQIQRDGNYAKQLQEQENKSSLAAPNIFKKQNTDKKAQRDRPSASNIAPASVDDALVKMATEKLAKPLAPTKISEPSSRVSEPSAKVLKPSTKISETSSKTSVDDFMGFDDDAWVVKSPSTSSSSSNIGVTHDPWAMRPSTPNTTKIQVQSKKITTISTPPTPPPPPTLRTQVQLNIPIPSNFVTPAKTGQVSTPARQRPNPPMKAPSQVQPVSQWSSTTISSPAPNPGMNPMQSPIQTQQFSQIQSIQTPLQSQLTTQLPLTTVNQGLSQMNLNPPVMNTPSLNSLNSPISMASAPTPILQQQIRSMGTSQSQPSLASTQLQQSTPSGYMPQQQFIVPIQAVLPPPLVPSSNPANSRQQLNSTFSPQTTGYLGTNLQPQPTGYSLQSQITGISNQQPGILPNVQRSASFSPVGSVITPNMTGSITPNMTGSIRGTDKPHSWEHATPQNPFGASPLLSQSTGFSQPQNIYSPQPQQQQLQFTGMGNAQHDKYAVFRNTDQNTPSVFNQGGQPQNLPYINAHPTGINHQFAQMQPQMQAQIQPQMQTQIQPQQQFANGFNGMNGVNGGYSANNINPGFVQNQQTGYQRPW